MCRRQLALHRRSLLLGALALGACSGQLHGHRRRVGFAVVNTRMLLHGRVTPRTPDEFADVLAQNPQVRTVVLQQMEGPHDPAASLRLGRMIRARGLATALQSDSAIAGDAVLLLMAGVERRMVAGAQIVLQGWGGDEARVAYAREMLGSDAFTAFALRSAPADTIHIMSAQDIAQTGLLTQPVTDWTKEG